MDFKKDFYEILQVGKNATKQDIKASYRKLALKYHPDKNHGNLEAEEKFKLVNEANEILSNDILRHEYDEYKKSEEQWNQKQKEELKKQTAGSANQRTYQKKNFHTKEKRIYIRGNIIIKYWGDIVEESTGPLQTEFKYKIHPNEVKVEILETDIHRPNNISSEYQKSFKESDLFKSPIPQPIKCKIHTSSGDEYYEIELKDIRLKAVKLEGITKHDGTSFGTLTGEIYAYTPKFETYEEIINVTECFGETGKTETKEENGSTFYRKEYYNPDCTTYWGTWFIHKKPQTAFSTSNVKTKAETLDGCLGWWWIPLLFLLLVYSPKFILTLLALALIGSLFYFGANLLASLGRLLSILAIGLFLIFLISAIRSSSKSTSIVKHDDPSYDTLTTKRTPIIRPKTPTDTVNAQPDTLINHFIRWVDYDSSVYETTLSIAVSDVKSSQMNHNSIEPRWTMNSLAPAYMSLLGNDESRLHYVYAAFDSIKTQKNLDEMSFAKMLVSCIQSIPYFLVVDRSCNDIYDDEYTRNYLASCTKECCVGYEKFGVRSPIEFVSDLKGDCDTRALFLYSLFKRYNYNVALLTSQYYKHAIIAVNFAGSELSGLSMNIYDKNFYLWETTSAGYNVGNIPNNLQNLDYWEISLLNKIN